MAATVGVSNIFADLVKFSQSGDWERALKATNKILQATPEDAKAFHCKVVCLVQIGKFHEALTAINKNAKLSKDLVFEKAYCQYRSNQIRESLKTLQSVPKATLPILELTAQVLYRLEEYDECIEVYKDIIRNADDDFQNERDTNFSAVVANLHYSKDISKLKNVPPTREDSYELVYNVACQLIAQGKFIEAEAKLRLAQDICRKALEEDEVPEDEIESELGIIRVQLGYVLQKLRRNDAAMNLFNQVLKNKPSDVGLTAVASNNVICLNKDQNVFDSKKKIKACIIEGLDHKLTNAQRRSILINHCLLLMYTNQSDQCNLNLRRLQERFPNIPEHALITAAVHSRSKQYEKAISVLQEFTSKYPDASFDALMALVQIFLQQDRVSQACKTMSQLGDISYRPGMVASLVSLYSSVENYEAASQVLQDSVEWCKKQPNSPNLEVLLREGAKFHLRHGKSELAAKMLTELRKKNPNDTTTLAQLITAYSQFDPQKALSISKELPPISELVKTVDVEALEVTNWSLGAKYAKKTAKGDPTSPIAQKSDGSLNEQLKKKRKKKKKIRYPKYYDLAIPPDPERWLPRKERSTYKRRKDKRATVGKGTQGSASGGDAGLDATKTPIQQSATQQSLPPSQNISQGPRGQQRRQQNQRKAGGKKGGKNKW